MSTGTLQTQTVKALERVLEDNRRLKNDLATVLFERAKLKTRPRHCGYCGHRTCACGLRDYRT